MELCARKVAAVSGDARRALDICRRAAEIAQSTGVEVSMATISQALQEMNQSPIFLAMQHCSLHERLFLVATLSQFRTLGVEEAIFSEIVKVHLMFCRVRGIESVSTSTLAGVCARLGASRLLIVEPGEMDAFRRVRLNCNVDDIIFALRDIDPTIEAFYLSR